jgi:adenosylmethionine---8-amino-7-oxononanoate aminotransferase
MEKFSLAQRDELVIWHPYTQHKNMPSPIAIIKAEGTLLWDDKGRVYIDAISSWWVTLHGHAHPYIAARIFEQAQKLEQVIFSGFTHEPAIELAERVLTILPGDYSKIFYSDNGSTAVEVAIKMAVQYWQNQPLGSGASRKKILAFKNAYHGDTFGAMSVSEPGIFTWAFRDYLFEVIFIDTPTAENIVDIKQILARQADKIACFIYEPLIQGAGGMLMHEPKPLDDLLDIIQAFGIICIADEVMTGFGRTGKLFAGGYLKNQSDILCLSKGLTGGTMAMGITVATKKIFDAFLSDDRQKTFFHGHSFTANPIACSAALASLDLLENKECREAIQRISDQHLLFAAKIKKYPGVKRLRNLGTVLAFEINSGEDGYLNNIALRITAQALQQGIYLRPLGNTIYIMPPYCITAAQLNKIYEFLIDLLERFTQNLQV